MRRVAHALPSVFGLVRAGALLSLRNGEAQGRITPGDVAAVDAVQAPVAFVVVRGKVAAAARAGCHGVIWALRIPIPTSFAPIGAPRLCSRVPLASD